jgi:hypothetical protein
VFIVGGLADHAISPNGHLEGSKWRIEFQIF